MEKKKIDNYYSENKESLINFYNEIENKIEGRICHSSVILIKIVCDLNKIENYLEIGVHNGGSMGLIIGDDNVKNLYGLDLFEDMYDQSKHLNKSKFDKYQYFKRDNLSMAKTIRNLEKIDNTKNLNLIQGNTYFDETEEKLQEVLGNNKLDLIHIDGDHTLDGVSNDFKRYFKYLNTGGFLAFDDYHHSIIKKYVDSIGGDNISKIGSFKFNSEAEQFLIKKV